MQGFEEGGPENQRVGFSQFLPGGGAGPDATPFERVYVVLDGEMTVEWDGNTAVLDPMDSCTVPPGQERRIENKSNHVCKMLVVIPYPEGAAKMSLSDPLSFFDVSGKVALITGASGAFGAVAAECLSSAGCKMALAAGNADAMAEVAARCKGEPPQINARPDSEAACADLVAQTVEAFGRLDSLVVTSGMNKVTKIGDMAPEAFETVMDANVTQSWLTARAASTQMQGQGRVARSF